MLLSSSTSRSRWNAITALVLLASSVTALDVPSPPQPTSTPPSIVALNLSPTPQVIRVIHAGEIDSSFILQQKLNDIVPKQRQDQSKKVKRHGEAVRAARHQKRTGVQEVEKVLNASKRVKAAATTTSSKDGPVPGTHAGEPTTTASKKKTTTAAAEAKTTTKAAAATNAVATAAASTTTTSAAVAAAASASSSTISSSTSSSSSSSASPSATSATAGAGKASTIGLGAIAGLFGVLALLI